MLIPNKLRTNYEQLRLSDFDVLVRNTIQTKIEFEHTLSAEVTTMLESSLENEETKVISVRTYKDYMIFDVKVYNAISYTIKTYKAYFHYTDIYTIEVSSVHLINNDITYKGVQ